MTTPEQQALYVTTCVVCGHALIEHHPATLRCQHRSKPHWWSRRVQCRCDMEPARRVAKAR